MIHVICCLSIKVWFQRADSNVLAEEQKLVKPASSHALPTNLSKQQLLSPELLAKTYILEGGVLDDKQKQRGGKFGERKGAYGDSSIRSNAAEGFGIVPMPGIIDADIRTKTAYGSLREAKVNFVCHNRRQLEVLELL